MARQDVSLDLLRTFHAVHRAGTLTGAARQLGLAQPTVTTRLQALEALTGQPLFLRRARGITPTAAGHDLARRLDGPLDALASVAFDLGRSPTLAGRTLHLGGPTELISALVMPALADTIAAGVAVRIRLGVAEELLGELANGQLELVISTMRPPRQRGLHVEPLFDEEFLLVAAPARFAQLDQQLLTEQPSKALKALPLLAYAEELPIVRRWWRHVLGTPPAGRAVLVVPDLRGLRAAALTGAGATVLPSYLCADDLATGRLVQLLQTDDAPINTLYLATRTITRNDPHTAHARNSLLHHARRW